MFVSTAWAQAATGTAQSSSSIISMVLPMVLIFGIFYFLVIRPQNKRQKEHQTKLKQISSGDTIITNGGLYGKVRNVIGDDELEVEIADGVKVRILRTMISTVPSLSDKGPVTGSQNLPAKKGFFGRNKKPTDTDKNS